MLFDETIRANIAYGVIETHDEAVVEAAKAAYAWEFIEQLPKGLDTLIGEMESSFLEDSASGWP